MREHWSPCLLRTCCMELHGCQISIAAGTCYVLRAKKKECLDEIPIYKKAICFLNSYSKKTKCLFNSCLYILYLFIKLLFQNNILYYCQHLSGAQVNAVSVKSINYLYR